ncbi:MAG: GerMN domain-containing protein [Spirochaetia bacterium]|nr:GerMN domain-containing protein [Spirochaetia bacterium]
MTRKTVNSKKKNKNEQNIVPILFTFGVIGWGFFAIDRLTAPFSKNENNKVTEQHNKTQSFRSYAENKQSNHVIESLRTWISEAIESKVEKNKKNKKNEIPIVSDKILEKNILEENTDDMAVIKPKTFPKTFSKTFKEEQKTPSVKLYYYENKDDFLQFYSFNKKLDGDERLNIFEKTFLALISGPEEREKSTGHIDSFVQKPVLNHAYKKENVLILDFDENFTVGLSFEMIRFQISQFLKTALQFQGIDSIQIKINGKERKHLEGDGLALPTLINGDNWVLSAK